jgi:hypothetical protein
MARITIVIIFDQLNDIARWFNNSIIQTINELYSMPEEEGCEVKIK